MFSLKRADVFLALPARLNIMAIRIVEMAQIAAFSFRLFANHPSKLMAFSVIHTARHVNHADALGVPHAVLLATRLDGGDAAVWWNPRGVVPVAVPRFLERMIVRVYFLHFPHTHPQFENDFVHLVSFLWVTFGFLNVTTDINPGTQHSNFRGFKSFIDDGFGVCQMCAVVHCIYTA